MHSYAPAFAGIVGRLNRARLRLVAQGVLSAALCALSGGVGIFAGLELLRRLRPDWWQDMFGLEGMPSLALAAALTGVIFAGGIVIAVLRAPPIEQLARRADRMFGLRERISTALEIERHSVGDRPAVVTAMLGDALGQGGAIDVARLAAFRLPRSAVLLRLAAIAAAAVMVLVPVRPVSVDNLVESQLSAMLGAAERATAAEDIRRVADAIEAEAVARGDTYMQAVATTLEHLGERLALTPETRRGDILEELGTLLDYASAAGRDWGGTAGERIPLLVEALEASIALPRTDQPTAARSGEPLPEAPAAAATDPGAAGDPATPPSTSIESVLEELASRNEVARAAASSTVGTSTETLDYMTAAPAGAAPRPQDNAQRNSDAPQLFGAQADAGAAEEQLAGDGTEPISDEAMTQLLDLKTTAEMVLTGRDTGEGRSLKVEITPDARPTRITEESLAVDTGAWRRTTESEAQRYAIGIDDRDMVSRYLRALPGAAQE